MDSFFILENGYKFCQNSDTLSSYFPTGDSKEAKTSIL